jgi:hypothetical protein
MSDGLGRIQRAVLGVISDAIVAHGTNDFDLTTADIVRSVYGVEAPTKAQRVGVLRVLRRLPNGPLPGAASWYLVRHRNRRSWSLLAPQPQTHQGEPPPSRPAPRQDGRLAATMRLLGSPVPGERDAAILAAGRLLEARNLSWDDVARAVDRLA